MHGFFACGAAFLGGRLSGFRFGGARVRCCCTDADFRICADRDRRPGGTVAGILAGRTSVGAAGASGPAGVSLSGPSRSSSEKSRSWVESGGTQSALGGVMGAGGTVAGSERAGAGFVSADNSLAICVPLSRKSSQPSRPNEIVDTDVLGVEICLRGTGCAFDAGAPGSLKLGFEFDFDSIRLMDLVG